MIAMPDKPSESTCLVVAPVPTVDLAASIEPANNVYVTKHWQ